MVITSWDILGSAIILFRSTQIRMSTDQAHLRTFVVVSMLMMAAVPKPGMEDDLVWWGGVPPSPPEPPEGSPVVHWICPSISIEVGDKINEHSLSDISTHWNVFDWNVFVWTEKICGDSELNFWVVATCTIALKFSTSSFVCAQLNTQIYTPSVLCW